MELLILMITFVSFIVTITTIPFWIKKAKQINLLWEDMHKVGHPKNVAGSGGVVVVGGMVIGILLYIALITFYFKSENHLVEILSLLTSMILVSGVALIDDLFGWRHGGLSKRSRIILVAFSAIPLMVINAGNSSMNLPLIGTVNFGLFFPLLIIPFGIVGATTAFNILAGYNGLESSQGILILIGLAIATYLTGNSWLSVICLYTIASLLAFYLFNKCPAKIFPGDVLTYAIGALIAIIAVLGNIERIAIIFFIPYIIQVILKLRGRLNKDSFAKLNKDGSLEEPYNKIYGLEHLAIRILKKIKPDKKVYEKEVVYLINIFQIIMIVIGFFTLAR